MHPVQGFAGAAFKTVALAGVGWGMGYALGRAYKYMGERAGGGTRYYAAYKWAKAPGRRAAVKRRVFGTHRYHWTYYKANVGSAVATSRR
jgi:hypothetical protein